MGQRQPFSQRLLQPVLQHCRAARDAALGYDTLCRSSELAVVEIKHVRFEYDGAATIFIPRSKSDLAGDRRIAYSSPDTAAALSRWLKGSELQSGPLFRALHLNRPYAGALETSSIRRIIKRATPRAGLDDSMNF